MKVKKIISALLSLAVVSSMITIPQTYAEELTGTVIYVAVDGNDANAGTEDAPLATMKGARDKIRQIKASGMPENGITVAFRGGSYKWTETLEFDAQDSGTENGKIVYRSYPGEEAVFEGGVRIPGTEFAPVTDETILMRWSNAKSKQAIRQINIAEVMKKNGYTDVSDYYSQIYDRYHFAGTYQASPLEAEEGRKTLMRRPIYSFDGEQALWLARYPNKDGGYYEETNPSTQFVKTGEIVTNGGAEAPTTFKYSERRFSKYEGYEDVYLFGHLFYVFYHDEMKVNIDSTNQTITTVAPANLGIKSNMGFYLFNILDELDAPGEYYVDKYTGIMYVYPNGDIAQKTLNVSLFDEQWMVKTNDMSNVTFSGLTFQNSKGGAIQVDTGDNVRIEYCSFNNLGTVAIEIGVRHNLPYTNFGSMEWGEFHENGDDKWWETQYKYWLADERQVGGQNNGVYGCVINNTGAGAIQMSGGNVYKNEEAGYYVENCRIENISLYKRTYSPAIEVNVVHGITIKDNDLGHVPAAIISGNTTKMDVISNDLYDGMTESYDNGLIYLNYQYPQLDVKFIDNYFRDTPAEHEITSSASTFSQRSGIAFDNSYGGGIQYINNVFKNIPRGVFANVNSIMNNNVFVDCFTPIQCGEGVTSTTIEIPEELTLETIMPLFAYTRFFLGWPIWDKGEVGQKFRNEWAELYPSVMEWVNIIESKVATGRTFLEAKNNLIVNKTIPVHAAVTRLDALQGYEGASRNERVNNVYTDDTSMFVDYANGNVQLTADGSAKYGNTLNIEECGVKIDMVGAKKYAEAKVALPTVSGGVSTPVAPTVPEKVKDAVVLTTHAPNALVRGTMAKVDSQNDQVMPRIIDSRTLVPARFISESFGGVVGWDADTRTVSIEINGKKVELTIDDANLKVDGAVATVMDVPAQIVENRTMVPLRVLCETVLGKKVFWDPKGLIVISDVENILDSTVDAAVVDEIMALLTK